MRAKYKLWSASEEEILISWTGNALDLADYLERSYHSVQSKARKLGKYFLQYPLDKQNERYCGKCEQYVDISKFDFDKTSKGTRYLRRTCNQCAAKFRTPETRVTIKQSAKDRLIKSYGLSKEIYQSMIVAQDNKCFICHNSETKKHHLTSNPFDLSIDHDHTTGKVRALLCADCNLTIGKVEKLGLSRIITYLEHFKENVNGN